MGSFWATIKTKKQLHFLFRCGQWRQLAQPKTETEKLHNILFTHSVIFCCSFFIEMVFYFCLRYITSSSIFGGLRATSCRDFLKEQQKSKSVEEADARFVKFAFLFFLMMSAVECFFLFLEKPLILAFSFLPTLQ